MNFVKGDCRQCGGHLEFPAEAVGSTVDCPHCGQPIILAPRAAKASGGLFYKVLIALCLMAALAAGAFFGLGKQRKPAAVAESHPAPVTNAVVKTTAAAPVAVPKEEPKPVVKVKELETNDFAISPLKLEKTAGSSLVYVTGRVRNLDGQPRYGVKLELGLSDSKGKPLGKATDYDQMLEPYGEWHFRALVLESKAVRAHFGSIQETH